MTDMILMALLNIIVGGCIGLTGIAGFLLPMFYTGFFGMDSTVSLALSFSAFLISGVLGSVNYYRSGHMDMRVAGLLSAGSFVGALSGVWINLMIPESIVRVILYVVVLFSGISILVRKDRTKTDKKAKTEESAEKFVPAGQKKKSRLFYIVMGLVTGAVCSASGAGGPVLVMPLLTLAGIPAHTAVGISLFESIFIALPATAGYVYAAAGERQLYYLMPVLLIVHGAGVYAGSKNGTKINQKALKIIVAVVSIGISCVKLFF